MTLLPIPFRGVADVTDIRPQLQMMGAARGPREDLQQRSRSDHTTVLLPFGSSLQSPTGPARRRYCQLAHQPPYLAVHAARDSLASIRVEANLQPLRPFGDVLRFAAQTRPPRRVLRSRLPGRLLQPFILTTALSIMNHDRHGPQRCLFLRLCFICPPCAAASAPAVGMQAQAQDSITEEFSPCSAASAPALAKAGSAGSAALLRLIPARWPRWHRS